MPNQKVCAADRAYQYKRDGFYCPDKRTVMCRFCNCQVSWERKDSIEKHLKSAKHVVSAKENENKTSKLQTSIATCFASAERKKKTVEYIGKRVTETFLSANIPLEKLENIHVKQFFNEFIEGSGDIPCVRVLREKYLPALQDERQNELKIQLEGKEIVVYCDETTDAKGQCIFVVLFKIIEAAEVLRVIVADVYNLETADAKRCSRAILDSLKKYGVNFDDVVAFVSDSARYMVKCFETLENLMSDQIVVVQCWAHKLNIVLNVLGKQLPLLQNATAKVKSVFLNTRKRKHHFRAFLDSKCPSGKIPLFPMPVITRWSSWFESVCYIADHFTIILDFIRTDEVVSSHNAGVEYFVGASKEELLNIQIEAVFVKETCQDIVDLIKKLEGSSYPCSHTLASDLRKIEQSLELAADGSFCQLTREKLDKCTKALVKGKLTATLTTSASHAHQKLLSLRTNDPASKFYKNINVLDPSEVVVAKVTLEHCNELKRVPFLSKIDSHAVLKGYKELQVLVKKQMVENNKVDMVSVLIALSANHKDFANAALKSIWLPCANVDCERFFSAYDNVLTDRRHHTKQENIELFTKIYFESGSSK